MNNAKLYLGNRSYFLVYFQIFLAVTPLFETFEKVILGFFSLVLYFVLSKDKLSVTGEQNLYFLALTFLLVVPSSIQGLNYTQSVFSLNTLGFIIAIMCGLFLRSLLPFNHFLDAWRRLCILATAVTIPIYVAVLWIPYTISLFWQYDYGGISRHKTIGILNILMYSTTVIPRYCGFAREPGVMAILLIIALYASLNKTNSNLFDKSNIVLTLGIFLTQSTMALMVLPLLLFNKFKLSYKYLLPLLGSLLLFSPVIYDIMQYHLQNKGIESASFAGRYFMYESFFEAPFDDVFLGVGEAAFNRLYLEEGVSGFDSFLQVSQRYGILTFATICFMLISANKRHIFISLFLIFCFFFQSVWFLPIISYFYFPDPTAHLGRQMISE